MTYEALLGVFFDSHDASRPAYSRQYRSAIFYHDEAQRETAERVLAARQQAAGRRLSTAVEGCSGFTRAEDYHQKYYLTHDSTLMSELQARYPDIKGFTDSTVVARLNGLAGGHKLPAADFGSSPGAESADLGSYGLPEAASRYLASLAASARQVIKCGGGQATPGGDGPPQG